MIVQNDIHQSKSLNPTGEPYDVFPEAYTYIAAVFEQT